MIPKIIHNIWIQGYMYLPEKEKKNLLSIKKINPKYKFIFWDEKSIIYLLSKYPKILEIYKNLEKNGKYSYPWKSDIARYVIMKEYGGIYCDLDFECYSSFDNLFDSNISSEIYIASSKIDLLDYIYTFNLFNKPKYCSCFMIFGKNHPIWEKVFKNIEILPFKKNIGEALDVELQKSNYKIVLLNNKIRGHYQCNNSDEYVCNTKVESSWNYTRPILKILNCNKNIFFTIILFLIFYLLFFLIKKRYY